MKEKRKIEVLSLIRDAINQEAHPTLRQLGLTEEEAQELSSEQYIILGDQGSGEDLDRYLVAQMEDKAIGFLAVKKAYSQQHIVSHHPEQSIAVTIAKGVGHKLWDWFWKMLILASGIIIGWYIKRHFP